MYFIYEHLLSSGKYALRYNLAPKLNERSLKPEGAYEILFESCFIHQFHYSDHFIIWVVFDSCWVFVFFLFKFDDSLLKSTFMFP